MTTRGRRQLGIRARLLLLSVAMIAVGILGAQWYVSQALARDLEARTHDELAARADLAAEAVRGARAFAPLAAGELVRTLARASGARVTLIEPAGRVIADSAVPPERLGDLDNHAARPEVRAAQETGQGMSDRESDTLHRPLVYIARRVEGPEGGPWVVRLAIAPQLFAEAHGAIRRLLVAGGLLGLLAAALMSSLAVQLLARPVRELTGTAQAMLRDLSVRTRMRRDDELGALACALDELASGLTATLGSLQHERDRLAAILEAMVEGVLVTDGEGRIVLANRALREMFLVGRDVVGQSPIEAVRDAELHEVLAEASRTRAPASRELAVGGVRPRKVMARVAPLEAAGQGAVAVLSDVTELRRLETLRRDFVANVSHELRTPIAAVRAAVETLLDGALERPEAAREFVAIIERHTERLHRLVEDLLELSRIEARELKLSLEPVEPAGAMARVAELFDLAAGSKRIRLVRDVAEALPRVHADRHALEQVLSNLIDNAIKYSPEGATVTVRARRYGEGVRLSVEDTGPGIEARHLPRLFERFYRVDAGRSRQLGGTGLGLAIVKHLAEAMDAAVSVDSTPGRGTTFHVDLQPARTPTDRVPGDEVMPR
jgi:two-component system phosphate regulon sensor histidine kinase PhoR